MDKAQDVVQQVFLDLYENLDSKEINENIYPYLRKAVFYKSLDLIKKERTQKQYFELLRSRCQPVEMQNFYDLAELENKVYEIVSCLPQQCQIIFIKSRNEGKSNKEIASELNISVRTVESHIFKALKKLKTGLREYLAQIIFTFF